MHIGCPSPSGLGHFEEPTATVSELKPEFHAAQL